jgi:hypothetical protein
MPVRHKEHQPYHFPGRQLPLRDRDPHEFARRQVIREFTQRNENPRDFETVMRYVKRLVEHFEERFSEDDTPILQGWHALRVEMLDIPVGTPDLVERSHAKINAFNQEYLINPKTRKFDENKFFRLKPVITEITYLVAKGNTAS